MAIQAQSEEVVLLPSAARTTTQTSADLQNLGGHTALNLVLDVTNAGTGIVAVANGGTGSATQTFVDLSTAQTVAGQKTFSANTFVGAGSTMVVGSNSADPDGWARFYCAGGGFRCDDDFRFKKSSGSQYITRFGGSGFDLVFQCQSDQLTLYGSGGLRLNQGVSYPVVTKTAAYTIALTDYAVLVDSTSAAVTITLPDASARSGQTYVVKDWKGQAVAHNITLATTSAQTIDGATTKVINTAYGFYKVTSDGANWAIVN